MKPFKMKSRVSSSLPPLKGGNPLGDAPKRLGGSCIADALALRARGSPEGGSLPLGVRATSSIPSFNKSGPNPLALDVVQYKGVAHENGNKHMHNLPSGNNLPSGKGAHEKVRPLGIVGRSGGVTRRGRKFTLRGFKRNYILCYMREMIETYTQENFRIYHIQNRIMHMTADQIGLNIERSKGSILAIMKRISRGGQRSRAKRYIQRRSTRRVFPQLPPLRRVPLHGV